MSRSTVRLRPTIAWLPVSAVVALAAAVHLAVATRYGWHRDEFYYVICGRHPAWGYVDHPPVTPVLARLVAAMPDALLMLRLLAIAAQVGCIVLAALLAAEFGGRRVAQVIAAAAVASCPAFMAASNHFGTSLVDQLIWLAVLMLVARALRLRTLMAWLAVGVVGGIGLENKHTVAVLLAGVAVGLVVFRREVLRSVGPWLAAGLAALLAVPNVVWNATHGWPSLQFARVIANRMGGPLGSLAQLPLLAVVFAGPLLVVLWVFGVRWLASPAGREHRWVLVAAGVALVVFTASGGRPYYAAPVFAALFAAGAVRVESAETARVPLSWTGETARAPLGWMVVIGVSFVVGVVASLPILPVAAANALRQVNPDLVETYGWPQLTDQVAAVASTLPGEVPIFTGNLGEAGALTILGPAAGLNRPVYSGHNNYALWGPPSGRPETVLCVGQFTVEMLHRYWSQVTVLASITIPDGVQNEEAVGRAKVFLCQQPRRDTWAELWSYLRYLS